MKSKPLPYCSAAMFGVLRAISMGKEIVNSEKEISALKARGWIRLHVGEVWTVQITPAGTAYLERHKHE
jgi:hypothetical protein